MRISWGLRGVAAVAIASVPIAARAQSAPPFDPAIDVQTFEYAVGPKTFVTVADGDVAAHKQIAVDALVTFLTKPFQIYNVDESHAITGARTTVVSSMAAAQLTCAYGITDRLQLGGNLPIVFALTGDGLMPGTGAPAAGGLNVTGLGDLVVEGKYRLVHAGRLKASAIGGLSLPSSFGSGGSQFIGDDLPTVRGKLAAQLDSGRLSLGVNAGILLRKPRTIYDSTIGQQLIWGVAGAVQLTERVSVIAEGYGRAGLPSFALDASPLEVEGGVRIHATDSVAIVIGGGAGLVNGIGSPESRLFLSLGYAPDMRDSDGDGIPNGRDKCPLVPEDKDGFEDDDGCPDEDNDGDGIPDATDKCPNDAETANGFEDDDGCPDVRATGAPEERSDRIDIKGQLVSFDKAGKLAPQTRTLLAQVATLIKARKLTIRVEVHVPLGTKSTSAAAIKAQKAKDKQLAQKRAAAIQEFLVAQGVAQSQLQAVGIGSDRPLTTPTDPVNERVDFIKAQQPGTP